MSVPPTPHCCVTPRRLLPARPRVRVGTVLGMLALLVVGAPRAAEAAEERALDAYFHGRVTALDGRTVTLRYAFTAKDELKDWTDRVPFRIPTRKGQRMRWFDEKLEIVGNSGARHRAEWVGDVAVKATFRPDMERDFGGYMSPVSETEDFAIFSFVETHFHRFDGSDGGLNSIIKFGAQWRESKAEEYIGFRYGMRKPPKTKIGPGVTIPATFGRDGRKLIFTLPDQDLKSTEQGKRLKRYHVGFYAIKGRLLLDDIEITGTLDEDWLKRERIALRIDQPVGGGGGVDAELAALCKAHRGGSAKATRALVKRLRDPAAGEAVHETVMEALGAGPKKAAMNVVELLYAPDVETRKRGITIIEQLLDDDFGYRPKASDKSRRKAIKKLNEAIAEDPSLLEG